MKTAASGLRQQKRQTNSSAAQDEQALVDAGVALGDIGVTKLRTGLFGLDFRGAVLAGDNIEFITVLDDADASVRTRIAGISYWGASTIKLDTGRGDDNVIVTGTDDETASLMRFLLDPAAPARRGAVLELVRRLMGGALSGAALERAVGTDVAALEGSWRATIGR